MPSGTKRTSATWLDETGGRTEDNTLLLSASPKRSRTDSASVNVAAATATATTTLAPSVSASSTLPSFQTFLLQQQVETFQLEIEHERTLRLLDQKRFRQNEQRLEKQMELAKQDADQAKALLDQLQQKHESITTQLRDARNAALSELRQCQLERRDETWRQDNVSSEEARVWKETCQRLEEQMAAQVEREAKLKAEYDRLSQDMLERLHAQEEVTLAAQAAAAANVAQVEDAPPAVMKELNRVRILLAESECRERKQTRKLHDLEQRNKTMIHEREQARLFKQRLVVTEKQVQELRSQCETVAAENAAYKDFREALVAQLRRQQIKVRGSNGPLEVATIVRFMDQAQTQVEDMEKQMKRAQADYQRLKTEAAPTEAKIKEMQETIDRSLANCKLLESQLAASEQTVATLEAQQTIYQREAESLRSLIKTFDDLPVNPSLTTEDVLASPKLNTSLKRMEVSLETARQELKLMTEDRNRLLKELEKAHRGQKELQSELDMVKQKFAKLRDALQAEKTKVDVAEQRANQAETLAGKGSFNPDTTRVLHIKETPLTEALREEIEVLKRQLEAAHKGSKVSTKLAADPEKLNQRLKENFKEQIALFREGVYLMTGFKVDMLPGTDRPTFRVRSVYAEHEEDHLMLKWPKGEEVTSLDLLNTDFAKALTTTPSYQYMTKFHSLPGFLASVQLSLFEKQTLPVH